MPLLHGKPFTREPVPTDLRPEEEVFLCSHTGEVFRNYEDFFNRQYLCNTRVWSCQLTGQQNMTYKQAVDSEREATQSINLLSETHKRTILLLLHKTLHSNMRSVVDEVTAFFKERFLVGEDVDYLPTPGERKLSKSVKIIHVNKLLISPVKHSPSASPNLGSIANNCTSAISSVLPITPMSIHHPTASVSDPVVPVSDPNASVSDPMVPVSDPMVPVSDPTASTPGPLVSTPAAVTSAAAVDVTVSKDVSREGVPKLCPYLSGKPLPKDYLYTVQDKRNAESQFVTTCEHLNRPKSVLTKEKVKLFLKNALYRDSDRHSLMVKPEYVDKYQLGPSRHHLDHTSVTPSSASHKRSLSQSNLDSFISTPVGPTSSKKQQMILSFLSPSGEKKASKSPQKKANKTPARRKSKTSTNKLSSSTLKSPSELSKTPSDLSSVSVGAKKALKKAKQMKQLDLRKSLVKLKDGKRLSQGAESKRESRKLDLERLKLKKLERKKELQEKRRLARLRELELKKPKEDTLCVDSKPLPSLKPVLTTLPPELFGDTVEVLEFLHHYGPVFNIKDVIRSTITFQKLEEALVSNHPDTILYGLIKFLLQSIFVAMKEEHEANVELNRKKRASVEDNEQQQQEEEGTQANGVNSDSRTGSRRSSVGSIPVEGMEEERSHDDRVASLKISATMYTKWPLLTQATPLFQLPFDPYTCSEILRLHLLSCGGYTESSERSSFRYCSRGGFSDTDDPVLEFRLNNSSIIDTLGSTSIYDLSPSHKLRLLSVLCLQLLGFASSRDYMEEVREESKTLRRKIRQLQASLTEKKPKKKEAKTDNEEQQQAEPKDISDNPLASKQTKSQGPLETSPQEEEAQKETSEERKRRVREEIQELSLQLYPLTACLNLQPLGSDREHNRYWLFPSLSGLFVERTNEQLMNTCQVSPPPNVLSSADQNSHASTGPVTNLVVPMGVVTDTVNPVADSTLKELPLQENNNRISLSSTIPPKPLPPPLLRRDPVISLCKVRRSATPKPVETDCQEMDCSTTKSTSTPSPAVAATTTALTACLTKKQLVSQPVPNTVWCALSSKEEIDSLMDTLNPRGIREVKLRDSIQKLSSLLSSVAKCPVSSDYSTKDWSNPSLETSSNEYLELYLREQLLDLEEKIWVGNLGAVRGAKDRSDWRVSIESSGAASKYNQAEALPNGTANHENDNMEIDGIDTDSDSVQELARAMLQIQQGIEKKFLLPPLGTAVDMKKRGKEKKNGLVKSDGTNLCLDEWRASLLKATSFSQLFVHLSTLERAVAWSKSLMNVRCRICRRKGGDEYMLLCDGCDHGYHTYCLRPPVYDIPEEDWFCYNCCPVTPMKRRRTVSTVSLKEVSDSESESEQEEEEEVEEESEEEEEEEMEQEMRRSMRSSTVVQRKAAMSSRQSARLNKQRRNPIVKEVKSKRGRKRRQLEEVKESSQARKRLRLNDGEMESLSKAEVIISSIIDVKCSKVQGVAQRKAQRNLEFQLSKALLDELTSHDDSGPFITGVRRREYPDYYDIITQPMDFKTIRQKVSSHKYSSIDQFLCDVNLIFSNCSSYFKRKSKVAQSGISLKKFFDQRYADLGLRNLTNSSRSHRSSSVELRSSNSSRY